MKPILFSTPMVQAIMNGTKVQTRRITKNDLCVDQDSGYTYFKYKGAITKVDIHDWKDSLIKYCPYGQTGDILWVRETFQVTKGKYYFKVNKEGKLIINDSPYKPSIFMPKDACRIFLKIINIRVERLQDISEEDAISEGIEKFHPNKKELYDYRSYAVKYDAPCFPYISFQTLWQSINTDNGKRWCDNPWVWVVEFEITEKPKL